MGESVRRRSRGERARGKDHTAPMAVVGIGVVVHEVVSIGGSRARGAVGVGELRVGDAHARVHHVHSRPFAGGGVVERVVEPRMCIDAVQVPWHAACVSGDKVQLMMMQMKEPHVEGRRGLGTRVWDVLGAPCERTVGWNEVCAAARWRAPDHPYAL